MRLHRLVVEAFGPFPGRVDIDVDDLTGGGLFLIHGPTGAGKTSLLDAVCFALYSDLPGPRTKRGLRSDHAAPDAVPAVELELTAGGRRLRIRRSPEHVRPKKRGTGLRTMHATVSLEELRAGSWEALSTRPDEVAEVVKDALGMGLAQFAKVVLLPQGEFAAFLRSSAEERRDVLERLFDIGRFSDVEEWLAGARRTAAARVEATEAELGTDLARLGDVLADPISDAALGWADQPVSLLPERLAEVEHTLEAQVSTTVAAVDAADGAERVARTAHLAGLRHEELRARATLTRTRLAELAGGHEQHEADRARLDAAGRAATLSGHLLALRRASSDQQAADDEVAHSRVPVARLGVEDWSVDALVLLLDRVQGFDRSVDDIARWAGALAELRERVEQTHTRLVAIDCDAAAVALAEAEAIAAQGEARERVARLSERASGLDLLTERLAHARERLALAQRVEREEARLAELRVAAADARQRSQDSRQVALDLYQRRIEGIAAELAGTLAPEVGCPVCGSLDHPAPATAGDAVTADDVTSAQEAAARMDGAYHRAQTEVTVLDAGLAERRSRLGEQDGRASLTAAARSAQREHAEAERACADLRAAEQTVAQTDTRRREAAELAAGLAADRARLDGVLAELTAESAAIASTLGQAVDDHDRHCPCASSARTAARTSRAPASSPEDDPGPLTDRVPALASGHAALGSALVNHVAAVEAAGMTSLRVGRATEDLQEALTAVGFEGVDDLTAAAMPSADLDALAAACATYDREVALLQSALDDPEVAAAAGDEPVDVAGLEHAEGLAKAAVLGARDAHTRATQCLRGLQRLRPAIEDRCRRLGPAIDEHARLKEVADTVGGLGPDNTLRMRLTSFVLAARLEKVAELANERLAVMGAGRFLLEHSDELAARGARSGLGLRVLDQWTGVARETSTLSGGEAFMASLALALGLADAVREEAGGFDLRTLFIDEGFGSLDDESLEQVLTVLDALREGGRAVGVVSHVPELRTRIPSQVVVHKGASGSTATVRTATSPAA